MRPRCRGMKLVLRNLTKIMLAQKIFFVHRFAMYTFYVVFVISIWYCIQYSLWILEESSHDYGTIITHTKYVAFRLKGTDDNDNNCAGIG